jgi:uncharacterized protein YgbK (DUF1537 family)
MTAVQLAILSDDLTGALDSAAPFANLGFRVVVATGLAALPAALASGAEVLAVSLSSREIVAPQAAFRAAQAARLLAGVPRLFKKIDSRLKGNIAAEVSAIAAVRGLKRVVICPAIPELGRRVRNGAVEGTGVPVPLPVAAAVALPPDLQLQCPDAPDDAALDALAGRMTGALPVGARGLAAALARQMAGEGRPRPAPVLPAPLAVLVGSRDPITLAQVSLARSDPAVAWLAAPDGAVPPDVPDSPVVVVQATEGATGAAPDIVSARLAQGFARGGLARRPGLVVTGGETAGAVLAELGVGLVALLGEVQPGLPLCQPLDFPGAPLIVTKSGGFGAADCLARLIRTALAAGVTAG